MAHPNSSDSSNMSSRIARSIHQIARGVARHVWARIALVCTVLALLGASSYMAIQQAYANEHDDHVETVCLSHDCLYHSINDALAHAPAHGRIVVAAGLYTPASETSAGATTADTTVAITKPITLQGAGAGKTILNVASAYNGSAANSGVVRITNPGGNVSISGFTFEGAIANDSTACCDDGILVAVTDINAADTISIANNAFYGDMTLDPQLLGDQEDAIYIADGSERVSVVHNTFQGVFRAALVEGQLGPVTFSNNEINGLHGLYDITTTPPALYYWAEAVFFLVDNYADVTSRQVVSNNTFEDYSGLGVGVDAGYGGGLVGAMRNMTIASNRFDNGGVAGLATPDSPDIYLHAFGYVSAPPAPALTATISGVSIKDNVLNLSSDTGQGTGIWLRGAIAGNIAIDHNLLRGSGGQHPPNGILFQGDAGDTSVTINSNVITGFDNGINAVTDPATTDQPPLGIVALPEGASVVAHENCIAGNSSFGATSDGPALINAEGNWWGAATGPNTASADSVGPNVDAMRYLTEPAGACTGLHLGKAGDSHAPHSHAVQHEGDGPHFHALDE